MNDNLATAADRLPRPQTGPRPQVSDRGGDAASAARLRRPAWGATSLTSSHPACSTSSSRPGPGSGPAASTTSSGCLGCFLDWAVAQQRLAGLAVAQDPATGDGAAPAVPVRYRPGPAAARGSRGASRQPAGHRSRADLSRHLRSLLRARAARRRGVRAAPGRRRRRPATARRAGWQVRQEPPGPSRTAHRPNSSPARSNADGSRARPNPTHRCSASTVGAACTPAPRARRSIDSSSSWPSRSPDGVAPPHLHCLRHSFAVGCLLRWYREGLDPATRLYQLSTFMGHVDPTSTAVYLTITPQLLAEANRRFEAFAEPAWSQATTMTGTRPLGPIIHSFFLDHLITVKGLRPASVRSYRDTIRLLLCFVRRAEAERRSRGSASRTSPSSEVLGFLRYLEDDRAQPHPDPQPASGGRAHPVRLHRRPGTGDARHLPAGGGHPDEAGGTRRNALPRTRRGAGAAAHLPRTVASPCETAPCSCSSTTPGRGSRRSPTCESDTSNSARHRPRPSPRQGRQMADLPALAPDRQLLATLLDTSNAPPAPKTPVFCSATGQPLTRFGIYKIVRRLAGHLDDARTNRTVSPHIFRHTAAVHLLEVRRRGQRDPRLARPRRPDHHQPLRRDQHQGQDRGTAQHRTTRLASAGPALTPSGGPTSPCSTGCHRSDRYVAGADRNTRRRGLLVSAGHIFGVGT